MNLKVGGFTPQELSIASGRSVDVVRRQIRLGRLAAHLLIDDGYPTNIRYLIPQSEGEKYILAEEVRRNASAK